MSDDESPHPFESGYDTHRFSPGPTTGGKVFKWEDVPEELRNEPEFWYALYRDSEGSYRDILRLFQDSRRNQQFEQRVTTSQLLDREDSAEELKSLFGIGAGMFTLLFAISTYWSLAFPASLLLGGAVTLTYIADRLSIPELLRSIKRKTSKITASDDG